MKKTEGWVTVDMEGLAQLIRRKGMSFILNELVQNAWDTDATECVVQVEPVSGKRTVYLTVFDNDPHGFKNLAHAYTLFAPSEKKVDPSKRGRFNLGEKLVLAACKEARISSTTGTVQFERQGKKLFRVDSKECIPAGSKFEAEIQMTKAEHQQVVDAADLLLPPIKTVFNGQELPTREPLHTFETTLPTEQADEEGVLRRTARKTQVRVYKPQEGVSRLYEMGIPVVEIDLPWSIEIGQKVPLNSDRDNITPAYQRQVGVLVVNEMHTHLTVEEATLPAVQEALADERIEPAAVETIITHQYGKDRVIFDPSDTEANANAFAHGHNVIPGGAFSREAWGNIKRTEVVKPAGQLFPTPKPYSEGGRLRKLVPEANWTDGQREVVELTKVLGHKLMDLNVDVVIENEFGQRYGANYGGRQLTYNQARLGKAWFDIRENAQGVLDLILHEFGHEYASSHLDAAYHKALTRLGAKLGILMGKEAGILNGYENS